MDEVCLEVEAVTPIFIAGADQRNIENEGLRVPSLKGLLRWWFRAIMGGMTTVNNLKKLENDAFGSTNKRSPLRITSTCESQPVQMYIPYDLRYLWFSIHLQRRMYCYPPGTKFKVTLSSRDKNSLKIALGCLWALIYLGGIGTRMRRGAGSLKVSKVSGKTPYEFIFNGKTVKDAKKFMEENLAKIFIDFKEYASERFNPQTNPNFAVLSRNHAKICLIEKSFNEWKDALSKISRKYQQFRQGKKLNYRYTLGLPIMNHPTYKNLRLASPLLIGVMDLNGTYAVRFVKFYTSIHPNFSSKLRFLEQDLENLDGRIASDKDLGEIEIKIPEVI